MLHHDLREARREYVSSKAQLMSSSNRDENNDAECSTSSNKDLKTMANYRRRHGIDALLRVRYNRKRLRKMDKASAVRSVI